FPDDGLCRLASTFRLGPAFESPYTKRDAPPSPEQVVRGTMYRGEDVVKELAQLLVTFRPSLIVIPHSSDLHPDHCATHLLAHQAIADAIALGLRPPRLLHYVVHAPNWPPAESADDLPRTHEWQWRLLPLTAAERTAKRAALDRFHSQQLV